MHSCTCKKPHKHCKLIVITGGPGAGKTAILELASRKFCEHIRVLPEAASIIFKGGFPREESIPSMKASQRAIFQVQHELEQLATQNKEFAIALCDRGTLDGLAYWPTSPASFFRELKTTEEEELAKYSAIIHLQPPKMGNGYNRANPMRIENATQAALIDRKIESAWKHHPHQHLIEATDDFMAKAHLALKIIEEHLPQCCRRD